MIIMQKKSFWKGSDTKIAYWNFNSNILGTQKFSLAQTVNKKSIKDGYIAPGSNGEFEIVLDGRNSQVDILYKIIIEKEETTTTETSNVGSLFSSFKDEDETFSTYSIYIVRNNETIETIMEKYKVKREDLENYNDLSNIQIGTKLIIPTTNE